MSDVNFSAQNRSIPDYAMNYPKGSAAEKASVFEQNNVRFRIEGHYLNDFSDKGIEAFIDKHYNKETGFLGGWLGWGGKDLELADVKAFIQAVAANADKVAGATFDLTDPELGLFDDDKISAKEIRSSFSINFKEGPGKSATEVSFVDAGSVTYHLKDAQKAEDKALKEAEKVRPQSKAAEKKYAAVREKRNDIAEQIGNNALAKLAQIDGRLEDISLDLEDLAADKAKYQSRIESLEKGTGLSDADKSLDEAGKLRLIRELKRAMRGMDAEREDLKAERSKLQKQLGEKHGFWSFLGGGSSLNELREANKALEAAGKEYTESSKKTNAVEQKYADAKKYREAIEKGQDPKEWAPKEEPTAVKPTVPTQEEFTKLPTATAKANALVAMPPQTQWTYLDAIKESERKDLMKALQARWQASDPSNPLGMADSEFKTLSEQRTGTQNLMAMTAMKYPETQDALLSELSKEHQQALLAVFNEQVLPKDKGLLSTLKLEKDAHEKMEAQAKAFMAKLEQQILASAQPKEPVKTVEQPKAEGGATAPVTSGETGKVEVPAKLDPPAKTDTKPVEPAKTDVKPIDAAKTDVKPTEPAKTTQVKTVTQSGGSKTVPKKVTPKQTTPKPVPQKTVTPTKTSAPLKEETAPSTATAVKEFVALPANTEQEAVNKIVKFKGYNVQQQKAILDHFAEPMAKAELLAALSDMPARRQELIGLFATPERQAVAKVLKDNQGNYGDPSVEKFIGELIQELEAKAATPNKSETPKVEPSKTTPTDKTTPPTKPVDSGKTVDLSSLQPSGGNTPPVVGATPPLQPVAVNVAPKIAELEKTLKSKTWDSYVGGGLVGRETINQPDVRDSLMAEIWMNGTPADRSKMAKLLVDNGQAKALGSLLGTQGVNDADVAAVVTASGFPTKVFMTGITDNQAFQVLNSVAKMATGGSTQAASVKFLKDTISAYTGTIKDRETPVKQMKTQAEQENRWNNLPQDLRDSITKLLK